MMPAAIQTPELGQVVGEGRFELLAKLGDGGTSVVYRARDRFLDRDVALKLLVARYLGRAEREQRLVNEAEYLRRLRGHPNIVEFVDTGRLRDVHDWPWLSTEILSGSALDRALMRDRLEVSRVLRIARQVLEALRTCHAAGIIHRDATPSNVFELDNDADRTIKLFDFSHAADIWGPKVAAGAPGRLTGLHDFPGTLGYMGPEQVQQDPGDPSMDVFGFGVLLCELVTRENPYARFRDRGAYIQAQRAGTLKPPRLYAWAYQVPEELGEIVHDCTQREGRERPTIEQLIARIDAVAQSLDEPREQLETTVQMNALEVIAEQRAEAAITRVAPAASGRPAADDGEVTEVAEHRANEDITAEDDTVAKPANGGQRPQALAGEIGAWAVPPREARPTTVQPPVEVPSKVVELAFARPPELRDTGAPAVVDPEPVTAPAPSFASEAVLSEEPSDDPGPVTTSRGWLWAALGGVALVLALLAWLWPTGETRDSSQDVTETPEPVAARDDSLTPSSNEGTDSGDSPRLEPVPEIATTDDGQEPEVESNPEPKPKPKPKSEAKPKSDPETDPKTDPPADCTGVELAAAEAAKKYDWAEVAKLTVKRACWSSSKDWTRLRVKSTWETGRTKECIKAGAGSTDPEIQKIVDLCRNFADQESP